MSPLLSLFTISFAIAFSAVITPGPVTTTVVSQSARNGWLAGPLISAGHAFLELILTLAIIWGLSPILNNPSVQVGIALLGGVLLLWMGVQMIFGALGGKAQLPTANENQTLTDPLQMVSIGIAATASNPFWYAWWITIAVSYLSTASRDGAAFVAAFFLGHISADLSWNTFLAAIIGGNRRLISNRVYQTVILMCGLFLSYLGIKFLLEGVELSHLFSM